MAQTWLQSVQTKAPIIGVSIPPVTGNAETIVNSLNWSTVPGKFRNSWRQGFIDTATTGIIPAYHAAGCGGTVSGSTLNISGALATAGAKAGAVALSKTLLKGVPVVGNLLESVVSLVSLPFAHHAQAVKNEQATLCIAVPAANQFLQAIDELLLTGQIDGPTAVQAMEQGYSNWRVQVKGILQDSGGKCNAACAYEMHFRCAIEYRKLRIASGAVLDVRGSNDVNIPAPPPPIPAGSTGTLLPAASGWNTPAPAVASVPPVQAASVLSLAGFTNSSQSRLALAVVLVLVFVFGVGVNLAIARRTTK